MSNLCSQRCLILLLHPGVITFWLDTWNHQPTELSELIAKMVKRFFFGEKEKWYCASFFSRVLRDSTPRFVRRSVGRSVTLYFSYDFYSWTLPLLPKWCSDLKHGPCPPARDLGSRVSGLVTSITTQSNYLFSRVHAAQKPALSVHPSVGPSISQILLY